MFKIAFILTLFRYLDDGKNPNAFSLDLLKSAFEMDEKMKEKILNFKVHFIFLKTLPQSQFIVIFVLFIVSNEVW